MATLGVVSYSMTPHNKMQILQQSTASNTMNHGPERREIIILRKKPKPPPPAGEVKQPAPSPQPPLAGLAQPPPALPAPPAPPQQPPAPPLAPAGALAANAAGARARKRPPGSLLARVHQPPPNAVARRNARERNRVKQVNNGFATLREHIPVSIAAAYASSGGDAGAGRGASKKLSKVETLRMAVDYIRSLQRLLETDENDPSNSSTSSVDSNGGFSSSPAMGSGNQSHHGYSYGEDKTRNSPGVVLLDEDDDGLLIDPASPDGAPTPSHSYGSSLVQSGADSHRKAYSERSLYEVDENLAPVIVSPTSQQNDARTLSPEMLSGVPPHLVAANLYAASPDLALLQRVSLPVPPPTTASLSPGVYSEQSASPGAPPDGAGSGAMEEAAPAHGVFLPAFAGALRATLGACPPTLPPYMAHAYHPLPLKREGSPAHAPPSAHDVMDIMSWWETDERLRHAASS